MDNTETSNLGTLGTSKTKIQHMENCYCVDAGFCLAENAMVFRGVPNLGRHT